MTVQSFSKICPLNIIPRSGIFFSTLGEWHIFGCACLKQPLPPVLAMGAIGAAHWIWWFSDIKCEKQLRAPLLWKTLLAEEVDENQARNVFYKTYI